jgi:ectoine hydroxylase-related dioxygenase (phytanoyl-CoA dioxygenase family)
MKQKIYRKTYLHLSDVVSNLNNHLKLISNKELFLTAFSSFFLLEKPFFDHTAHEHNSIQTFYANHYLLDCLKVNSIPPSDILLNYCKSNIFAKDLIEVLRSEGNLKNDSISHFTCKEISPGTLLPSLGLQKIITLFVNKVSKKSGKYLKTNLTEPSEEVFNELKSKGFYVLENFLNDENLRKIKKITSMIADYEAKKRIGYFYGEKGNNQRIYNLVCKHPVFQDLICHPYMMNLLDRVYHRPTLHEKFTMNSMTGHIVAPGEKALPLHIDSVVPDPIPNSMIRFIAVLALDDFTKNNGATEVVPKSHKLLRRPMRSDAISAKGVKAVCKAGSLIMFNGSIWHHSTANNSKNSRMGLMLSYAASYFLEVAGEEEHLTVIPKKNLNSFSPKMKQMVGYQRAIKKGALHSNKKIYNLDLDKL